MSWALQLFGLFHSDGGHSMLDEKDYHCIYMMFPFICAFGHKVTGYTETERLNKVNIL